MGLEQKTVKELRGIAKARGLKGFAALNKEQLLRLLDQGKAVPTAAGKSSGPRKPKAKSSTKATKKPVRERERPAAEEAERPGAEPEPRRAEAAGPTQVPTSEEELVEEVKFTLAQPGTVLSESALAVDLGEDIGQLPPLAEPLLCLLPQKPGVLHGYWVLPPGLRDPHTPLRLRLARLSPAGLAVIEEIAIAHDQGHWYFHVTELPIEAEVYLELGYYRDEEFVSAVSRGIARIPSLYASEQADRRWWVSPAQFRAMYLRAGGFARGTKLGWTQSISSR